MLTKMRLILICVIAGCATVVLCVAMLTGTPLDKVWECIGPHLARMLVLGG